MNKVAVLGAGSWGTALAISLSKNINHINLWGRPEDDIESMQKSRENKNYLPGVTIPPQVKPTTDLAQAVEGATMVVLSVPAQPMRSVLGQLKPYLKPDMYLVNTAKGLEISSGMRLSRVVEEVLGPEIRAQYAVLSGPSHAEEVAREVPTAITAAAYNSKTAFAVQDYFMSESLRVYTNPDVAGVELGGALKNIIALATGIVIALGYGDNTVAALMTRGLAEMTRIGVKMGGNERTFSGLSGMGDLIVTCGSRYSRNRRAGELIGQGKSLEETLDSIGMVVEGAHTTRVVYNQASRLGVEMPITNGCYKILYEGYDARGEVSQLMNRRRKHEIEENVMDLFEW